MPIIDLSFVLVGTTFPLDHGYSPYSAICRIILGLHGDCPLGHLGRSRETPGPRGRRWSPALIASPGEIGWCHE
jgi:hypothetical protein